MLREFKHKEGKRENSIFETMNIFALLQWYISCTLSTPCKNFSTGAEDTEGKRGYRQLESFSFPLVPLSRLFAIRLCVVLSSLHP